MIKNIIFDIGNVLAKFGWKDMMDSYHFPEEKYRRIADAVFLNPLWEERDRGVMKESEITDRFVKQAPQYETEIRSLVDGIQDWIIEYEYAPGLVRGLKERGYRCFYLSNYPESGFTYIIDHYQFFQYMEGGIASYQVKCIKPDPQMFQILMERYGLEAQECLFLDDTKKNLDVAESLGMRTILVDGYESIMAGLRENGVL